ncbi:phosphatase PAP2 family protein [Bradyrhizobium sp. UFLA05-153]
MSVRIHPTKADIALARTIARNTRRAPEEASSLLTWGADGHVLTAFAIGWWFYYRARPPAQRAASNHVLLTTLGAVLLPHLLKRRFNEVRPDRRTVQGHLHGVPLSGRALDAFPSGHAVHVGALASVATELPPAKRNLAWTIGALLVGTRVVLLAHWASDVIAALSWASSLSASCAF